MCTFSYMRVCEKYIDVKYVCKVQNLYLLHYFNVEILYLRQVQILERPKIKYLCYFVVMIVITFKIDNFQVNLTNKKELKTC